MYENYQLNAANYETAPQEFENTFDAMSVSREQYPRYFRTLPRRQDNKSIMYKILIMNFSIK